MAKRPRPRVHSVVSKGVVARLRGSDMRQCKPRASREAHCEASSLSLSFSVMWLDLDKGASANRKPRAGGFQPFGDGDRYRRGEQRSAVRGAHSMGRPMIKRMRRSLSLCLCLALFIYLSGDGHQQLRRICPPFATYSTLPTKSLTLVVKLLVT